MAVNAGASEAVPATGTRFSSQISLGRRDGLGERSSAIDALDGKPVELLRLRHEVISVAGFDRALRERLTRLALFTDLSFSPVREVVRDGTDLTLVSSPAPGQPLPEFLARKVAAAKRPAFVAWLLRRVLGALAALEATGAGITHGALTGDRILVSSEGSVCITEYVFASALQQLSLWPEELWLQFGLLAPADASGQAVFDERTTVTQLAAIALTALLDRSLTLDDFEQRVPALLDEFVSAGNNSRVVAPLRAWLERALRLDGQGYPGAADAEADLRKLIAAAGPAATAEIEAARFSPAGSPRLVERKLEDVRAPTAERVVESAPPPEADAPDERPGLPQYVAWVAVALGLVAVGEAAIITGLLTRSNQTAAAPAVVLESPEAGSTVVIDGRTVGTTPLRLTVDGQMRAIRLVPRHAAAPGRAAPAAHEPDKPGTGIEQAAARQRSGGVVFSSPVELKVLEGDRVLGSTADGAIVAPAGVHHLDLVNTALGYRSRQTVTFKTGVIARQTIQVPMGRISINAQPWAQVLIDEVPIGDTPLADVPVTIGDHQVTFRHPQLGERRERVTVRADTPARLSTTFGQ